MRHLLISPARLQGPGLHSGAEATIVIHPAAPGAGITAVRTDLPAGEGQFSCTWDKVAHAPLCTQLSNDFGHTVSTIEHVMGALAGLGVFDARIDVDGPEIPILDGSALPFVKALRAAGLRPLLGPCRAIRILAPVAVSRGDAWAVFEPATNSSIEVEIAFPDPAIGRQGFNWQLGQAGFDRLLAPARTFCRASDIEMMRAAGRAIGGSLESAIVVDGPRILTPGGLRLENEFARHKTLDALGDLALLGLPFIGRMRSFRPGHRLTQELVAALVNSPDSFRIETASDLCAVAA